MTLVGCDLHTRKQQVAVLDTETGAMYNASCPTPATPWSSLPRAAGR